MKTTAKPKYSIGRKLASSKPVKTENRTDGFVAVGREENWAAVGRSIREKIEREGPWASAFLPSFLRGKNK